MSPLSLILTREKPATAVIKNSSLGPSLTRPNYGKVGLLNSSANGISQHTDFHAVPRNSPFAAEFAAAAEKLSVFKLHLHLIQGFSLLILPFIT